MIARLASVLLLALTAVTGVAVAQPYPPPGPPPYGAPPYGPPPRPYPPPQPRFYGCVAYEDIDFGGARLPLRPGRVPFVGQNWNDRISSISCSPGCRFVAFEDINFGGRRQTFVGRTRFVGQFWNDRISAVDIRCQ